MTSNKICLTPAQDIGLSPWFVRSSCQILARICAAGDAAFWSDRVEHVLEENKWAPDGRPKTWRDLATATGRESGNFSRYKKPEDSLLKEKRPQVADALLRHQVAVVLGRDDTDLSPSTVEWIASSTRLLLRKFRTRELAGLHGCDTLIYAKYVIRTHQRTLFDEAFVHQLSCMCKSCSGPEKVSSLLIVCQIVGEILQENCQDECSEDANV